MIMAAVMVGDIMVVAMAADIMAADIMVEAMAVDIMAEATMAVVIVVEATMAEATMAVVIMVEGIMVEAGAITKAMPTITPLMPCMVTRLTTVEPTIIGMGATPSALTSLGTIGGIIGITGAGAGPIFGAMC